MQDTAGAPLTRATLTPFALVAVLSLVADQASKAWALRDLDDGHVIEVIGDLLSLRLIRNPGAAFSLGDSSTLAMTALAVVITAAVAVAAWRTRSRGWALSLGALFGGSLGNLYDRFFRDPSPGRGHVIDFIDYGGLVVGNVADIAIVLGAAGLLWLTFTDVGLDGVKAGRHARTGSGQPAGTSAKGDGGA